MLVFVNLQINFKISMDLYKTLNCRGRKINLFMLISYCSMVTCISISLYKSITLSLSHCHYPSVSIILSLCHCNFVTVTISLAIYLSLCHLAIFTMTLSLCCYCHYIIVPMNMSLLLSDYGMSSIPIFTITINKKLNF